MKMAITTRTNATAESAPYSGARLAEIMARGRTGIERLFVLQREALARDLNSER